MKYPAEGWVGDHRSRALRGPILEVPERREGAPRGRAQLRGRRKLEIKRKRALGAWDALACLRLGGGRSARHGGPTDNLEA